ncbi:hypothetical protein MYCTH_2299891 [Thermothelomyces thermophilus ATCC 42464]|uniref:Modin n=1 Tax=Thermothelomyces thermophilus (strain ATCC 42464 / BCRC 31852 / DSM 1799) TaxID=573729 RepID=G2Q079_THET4|nr:uncharacterized protein MYCTH_2299891 [Thermothelomyces thermophilus ATCC 42464]AEO55753.1 hypothetical protein MYCTH_2299891 [Thermothelomyces thermophilus ATCC 42464]
MSNSNSAQNGGGCGCGGGDDDDSVVNWAALVISLVALLGTAAQVLQQYIASAAGYANCGENVMGKWHESKKRKFRPTELRFEVRFQTPVIFVCPTNNLRGPIMGQPICFVDGTKESLVKTRAMLANDEERQRRSQESRVHTADNERASWVVLLSHLQTMENESAEWQKEHYKLNWPYRPSPVTFQQHTLAVALQPKERSWDTMPAGVKKPYATTTICHLLEIAAMMGIYWKEFDRSRDRYRAEGNGYLLTGVNVPDLGVMFTLQVTGKSKFRENRVIPVDEVKELCCGFVSTLFRESKDPRRIEFPNEDTNDMGFLQLGSMDEIAETMVQIQCNTDTANYFRSREAKHRHLFPVPFELLGMLGKTLHIRDSGFRMLPNPTPYRWDKKFFNLRRLVKEYRNRISDTDALDLPPNAQIQKLETVAKELVDALSEDMKSKTPGNSLPLLSKLHEVLDQCDDFLKKCDRDLVRMVLREHFQEVMRLINEKSTAESGHDIRSVNGGGGDKRRAEHFDELTAANPEQRQEAFMELYFFKVLRHVKTEAVKWYCRRRQTTQYAPSMHSREPSVKDIDSDSGAKGCTASAPSARPTTTTPASSPPPGPTTPPVPRLQKQESGQQRDKLQVTIQVSSGPGPNSDDGNNIPLMESKAAAIWCTLVLRMLCWLLLHDFDKKDVQEFPKSELLGSRLPVYIA